MLLSNLRPIRPFFLGHTWTHDTFFSNSLKVHALMQLTSQICEGCHVKRGRNSFLRPHKQRLIVEKLCSQCRAAALLKDKTGRAIQRALARNKITEPEARALQATLKATREAAEKARRAKLSAQTRNTWDALRNPVSPREQARRKKISDALKDKPRAPRRVVVL